MDRLHAAARAAGRSAPVGSAPSRTVWRDATGRIVRQGDLRAVTAECSDGRVWDVRGDNPILVTPNAPRLPPERSGGRQDALVGASVSGGGNAP